jgi:carbon-monoxide dehydrogenase iron sulfur subunit
VCPTAAITRNADLDLVLIDPGTCIACAMCAMVCPFDAVTFHPVANGASPRIVATKCDGCVRRVEAGEVPACVEACKVGALVYGDINELVAEGRLRSAKSILTAAASIEVPTHPDSVEGWREFGRELTTVAGSV